jgi:glycosyltransferase involved in cell wall biosynthesis
MNRRSLPARLARALWLSPPVRALRHARNQKIEAKAHAFHLKARTAGLGRNLKPGPVVVSGFLEEALGIGRGGRLTAGALKDAGFTILRHDIRPAVTGGGRGSSLLPGEGGVWLLHCNPPEALQVLERVRTEDLFGRYRIGYWAWELPQAPSMWLETARFFDEIWTPSQFTADSLKDCGRPVRVMPHPVPVTTPHPDRARFGMKEDVVEFLAMADLRSSAARKNPLGAIQAFTRAYPAAQGAAALTVKIVHPEADPAAMAALATAAGGRRDIRLFDVELSTQEVEQLIASTDVVLSLHRAEGFGLTLAEAFGMGRPALATGWSGNMEFMGRLAYALIPFRPVAVDDPSQTYGGDLGAGQVWADPDLDAAAVAILKLAGDAKLRAQVGAAGREAVARLAERWTKAALAGTPISRWSPPA